MSLQGSIQRIFHAGPPVFYLLGLEKPALALSVFEPQRISSWMLLVGSYELNRQIDNLEDGIFQ